MDAFVMRSAGGAPAAREEDASQVQDPVEQYGTDGEMDGDENPEDDIEPVLTNCGEHNGYLLPFLNLYFEPLQIQTGFCTLFFP